MRPNQNATMPPGVSVFEELGMGRSLSDIVGNANQKPAASNTPVTGAPKAAPAVASPEKARIIQLLDSESAADLMEAQKLINQMVTGRIKAARQNAGLPDQTQQPVPNAAAPAQSQPAPSPAQAPAAPAQPQANASAVAPTNNVIADLTKLVREAKGIGQPAPATAGTMSAQAQPATTQPNFGGKPVGA